MRRTWEYVQSSAGRGRRGGNETWPESKLGFIRCYQQRRASVCRTSPAGEELMNLIRKFIGFGIGRAVFAVVFIAWELLLAPQYFQNLFLLFLKWEEITQGEFLLPSIASGVNALFLAWALALLAALVMISGSNSSKR